MKYIQIIMIITLRRLGSEGDFKLTKSIFWKPTTNIILNHEKLKTFPLRSGTKQGCSLYPLLFNIITEVPVNAIGQEKEIKDIQIRKEIKLSLFAYDMCLHIKSQEILKKFHKTIKWIQQDYKIKDVNQLYFYILTLNIWTTKSKLWCHL